MAGNHLVATHLSKPKRWVGQVGQLDIRKPLSVSTSEIRLRRFRKLGNPNGIGILAGGRLYIYILTILFIHHARQTITQRHAEAPVGCPTVQPASKAKEMAR